MKNTWIKIIQLWLFSVVVWNNVIYYINYKLIKYTKLYDIIRQYKQHNRIIQTEV